MKTSPPIEQRREGSRKKRWKPFHKYMQAKLLFTFVVVAAALLALSIVLLSISGKSGEDYSKIVLSQQNYSSSVIPFQRGTITDRNQTVLATSEQVYNLILDPSVILANDRVNLEVTLDALVQCYGYDREELAALLEERSDSAYIRYARQLSAEEKEVFESYEESFNQAAKEQDGPQVAGVWFESEYKRVYPYNSLASAVLGFSGSDSSRGNWGIEQYYNDQLVGTDGRSYGYMNTDGELERVTRDAIAGNTIVSTIDYTIQSVAEQYIAEFLTEYTADNVGVLVMNPNNGEILAMATSTPYDLNDPSNLSAYYDEAEIAAMSDEEKSEALSAIWKNFAVQDVFEPGSTAKPFTVAAGLEENLIQQDSEYICDGGETFGSGSSEVRVNCNVVSGHGQLTLTESLMYSCNDAMMAIGQILGNDVFAKYLSQFGFGRQSGIDLPGESPGLVYSAADMGVVDLATNSFGQNYNVNMVQLASAFCSLINGGSYYMPHVVKQILSPSGDLVEEVEPVLMRKTVSESTSEFIRNVLWQTVETGTGSEAQIEGYDIGGKTGTAQKHPRSEHKYLVSFIGFAPAEQPEVVVYVVVDNPEQKNLPEGETTAVSSSLAIAIEKKVMEAILPYLNIPTSADYVPETTASPESAESTDPETDAEGNTLAATASASYEEAVPAEGILTDSTESGEALTESETAEEEGGEAEGADGEPEEGSVSQEGLTEPENQ